MTLPSDWPLRIRALRRAMGLKQPDFAELVGVSPITISRWENGQNDPTDLAWARIQELESRRTGPVGTISEGQPDTSTSGFRRRPGSGRGRRGGGPPIERPPRQPDLRDRNLVDRPAAAPAGGGLRPYSKVLADPLPAGRRRRGRQDDHDRPHDPRTAFAADGSACADRSPRRGLSATGSASCGISSEFRRASFGARGRQGKPFSRARCELRDRQSRHSSLKQTFARLREAGLAGHGYDLVVFDEAHKLSADRDPMT